MWREDYVVDYAVFNDTLVMKENGPEYASVFYYPIGNDVVGALKEIETFARSKNLPLSFGCLTDEQARFLTERYYSVDCSFERDWCDYIYSAEQFKTYAGKKLSGQRNHVNKFKKLYPNYSFKVATPNDLQKIKEFFAGFKVSRAFSEEESNEICEAMDLTENMFELGQVGGYIEVDGRVVAFSIGEVVGETLIVHIEKALTEYQGVYPLMAKEFACAFATDNVKYINREEDCGDEGLRTSKTQYRPIELVNKNYLQVFTLFDKISAPVSLKTQRLTITDVKKDDKDIYRKLYLDDDLNKWWGYDYREDLGENEPTVDYFFEFMNSLKKVKEEYSLAVRVGEQMIGELVLHNFDFYGGVEMGFRFFSDCQGKGYAIESASALKDYVKTVLGAKRIKSRCFKENVRSRKVIERLGLKLEREDATHFYFGLDL